MDGTQEYNNMLCDWILTLRIQWGIWQCFKPWGFSNSLSSSFIWLADFFLSYKFYCSNIWHYDWNYMSEVWCFNFNLELLFPCIYFQYTYIVVNNWTCCISNHMYLVAVVSFNANTLLKMLSSYYSAGIFLKNPWK